MTNKKSTRRALFMSVISLMLCCAMLVGTTFAWFTDSVESGINTIAAGNLDVELYYGKDANPTAEVTEDKELFTDFDDKKIELWEPGVVAYTNLKVANVGNLALKYQLSVNFTNMNYVQYEAGGKEYTLADALKVAVVDGGFTGTNREDAQALDYNYSLATFDFAEVLEQGETSDVYGIVIYWEPGDDATDNLFNMNNRKTTSDGQPLHVDLGVNLFATQQTYEEDSFGSDYDDGVIDVSKIVYVSSLEELQAAVDAAENGTSIVLNNDISGQVTVTQKQDVDFTIDGNGKNYTGTITVDGKSARYAAAGLTIKNVNFVGGATTDAYVALGGTDAQRYTNGVAVVDCTFAGVEGVNTVAVKSYTGGDHNVTIDGCYVDSNMHSLAQLANVEKNLKITDCQVNSKNGANLNNTLSLYMSGCTFNVQGYAVRFGVNGTVNTEKKDFVIANSILNSAHADGDTAIIFRDSSKYATLNLVKTKVEDTDISGNTEKTTILRNGVQEVSDAAALSSALAAGGTVVMAQSISDAPVATTALYGNYYGVAQNGGVLDGNGKTLDFEVGPVANGKTDNYGIMTSGGTIKNVTITGVFRGIMIMNPTEDVIIDNVTIGGDEDLCYAINTGEGDGTHNLIVTNSTIKGWSSYGNIIKSVTFSGCTFAQGTYYDNVFGRLVKPYVDAVFENCEFNSKFYIDLSQLGMDGDSNVLDADAKIVLKNCTVNGVKLTAENWMDLIVAEDVCGEGQISIEGKDGSYMTAENIFDYVVIE